eukprot:gnl/TRDRNA2_/TRDRNA2_129115_c0_seq2.p1 gnl/TRDRNA2_/TRDRNA2_129115_c0~~gnl/TRDRNA2_/TRDRNA2_129115_c0_seq2.p1  ORF type:complete len:137 (+),score=23.44 gnl/TRDRNA2_/TRDRNA2_129115_c0_seq2:52-462(+)
MQKFAIDPGGKNKRSRQIREKTCKRCGVRFLPATGAADCRWHLGKYQEIDEDGIAQQSGDGGAALQRQIKEQLRRTGVRKSKGNCHVEVVVTSAGTKAGSKQAHNVANLSQTSEFRWSCCGASLLTAAGCRSGPHC